MIKGVVVLGGSRHADGGLIQGVGDVSYRVYGRLVQGVGDCFWWDCARCKQENVLLRGFSGGTWGGMGLFFLNTLQLLNF